MLALRRDRVRRRASGILLSFGLDAIITFVYSSDDSSLRGVFMLRLKLVPAMFVLLLTTVLCDHLHAEDLTKSPEEFFKSKGLIKTGFMLILPQEQALHDVVAALRTARGKLNAANAKIRDADAQLKSAQHDLNAMEDEIRDVDARMTRSQRDNTLIDRHNALVDQINEQLRKVKELTDSKNKVLVSRSDYITAVLNAVEKADAAQNAYDAPHADKDLAAVIDKYNLTAKPKVKLGPSAYFNEDLKFINQCKADVSLGTIAITTDHGVPNVQVLINGQLTQVMIWDSGCTGITLSAKTARALGLRPSKEDQIEEAVIADGRHVKEHIKMLDSIRIGAFTVKNVECTIPPDGSEGADLLGNEFQHNFQFKLDINNQTLQLSPLDPQAITTDAAEKPAIKPPAKPTADSISGVWFQPASGASTTLNADGTATSKDGIKGTWTANAAATIITIKWTKNDGEDIFRLSRGKWTMYGYANGELQSTDEISPP
jgi:clan AA aspartic protease (TIGR02281 family)